MATTKVSTKLLETVGVAEGGTGATSTSAARTSLGLVIGTNVLAPNGSAASLTNLPAGGASAAEAANIMVNSFNIAAAGGFAYQNMVDGVVDEFEDETGVDTSTSTNEAYDATDDLYANLDIGAVTTSSANWDGNTGNFTFSSDDISHSSGTHAIRSLGSTPIVLSGDFEWYFTATAEPNSYYFGVYPISEDSTFNSTDTAGGMAVMNDSWYWNGESLNSRDGGSGGSSQATSWGNGDVLKMIRVGAVFTMYVDGSLVHTYTGQSTVDVRFILGCNSAINFDDIVIASGGPRSALNMTLVSNASTALAAPDDANIVIWQEDVDSVTLNTDLKAYASRNGGTTYTQMTLAEVANLTTGRILTGTVDISGQSSATAMKYKIETLNTKHQKIHAVALQWS